MVARSQNYPESQTMTALGMARFVDSSNAYIQAPDGSIFVPGGALMAATPLAAGLVQMPDVPANCVMYLTPAGTLATLTINVASDANSVLGQQLKIFSTQIVTALTVAQLGGGGTFIVPVTSLAVNTPVTLVKVAANTWAKM